MTAQKRSEKLQNVPVAVSAFSARDLAKVGVTAPEELNELVAGLQTGVASAGTLTPFLRGIGNNATSAGNEASTAIYVDNVYIPRLYTSFFELQGIDRIEVLKGPQGTLFGRNASGGLINILTKDPSLDDYELQASVGYDNYDTNTEKLYLSAPITDQIAANVSVYHADQGRAWGRDFATGNPFGYEDPTVIRSKWLFNVTDDLKVTAAADYAHSKSTIGETGNIFPGTTQGIPTFYLSPPFNLPEQQYFPTGFYDNHLNGDNRTVGEGYGGFVRIDYDAQVAKLSSISSLRQQNDTGYFSGDYVPIPQLEYSLIAQTRTLTQEFQVQSEKNSAFDWIVGLYYLNTFAAYAPTEVMGPALATQILGGSFGPGPLPDASTINLFGFQRILDYAGYGQATFHATDNTDITLGVRYTYDKVEGRGRTDAIVPGVFTGTFPGGATATAHFYKPTYKVAIDHHFTDDVMSYLSYSRGFKAGTFNTLPLTLPVARPEVVDAYELGVKSSWFDKTLQLNGAFFYYHINDPQVFEVVNHLDFLANAGAAEVKGVDIDGQYAIERNLIARFGAEYLDAHYTSFLAAPVYTPLFAPPYGSSLDSGNVSGNQIVNAPRFTFNVGLNYVLETSPGTFNFNTNFSFNSGYKLSPDNFVAQRSYELLDASVSFTPADYDNWEIRVWGKNLTAQKYILSALENAGTPGFVYAPAAPCTFGAELTYRFSTPRNPEPEAAPPAPTPAPEPAAPPAAAAAPAPEAKRAYQVFFDFDKSAITPDGAAVLQQAAASIKAGNHVKVVVTGHTDTVGSARYNQKLSERRAAAVKAQLISDGVMSDDIATRGVGKTDLLVPTPDGVREPQNRRAEIVEQQPGA